LPLRTMVCLRGGNCYKGIPEAKWLLIFEKKRTGSGFELKIVALVIGVSTLRFIDYLYASFYY
jgi:hypothetical protein